MNSWSIGERVSFVCDICQKRAATKMNVRGRENSTGICNKCRKIQNDALEIISKINPEISFVERSNLAWTKTIEAQN